MPAISVTGLTKTFRTYKKQPGFRGAIRGLFHRQYEQTVAVKDALTAGDPREEVFRDLFWALLNSKEFAFNH